MQVQSRLERFKHLEGFQASERDGSKELLKVIRSQPEENIGKLHQRYCNGRMSVSGA
jgi:hypothetical protein